MSGCAILSSSDSAHFDIKNLAEKEVTIDVRVEDSEGDIVLSKTYDAGPGLTETDSVLSSGEYYVTVSADQRESKTYNLRVSCPTTALNILIEQNRISMSQSYCD